MISQGNLERRLVLKHSANKPLLQRIFKVKSFESHCFLLFSPVSLVSSSLGGVYFIVFKILR